MRFLILISLFSVCRLARAEESSSKEMSIEDFLQSLSTVKDVTQRRDPFSELAPPFEAVVATSNESDSNAPNMSAPILERFGVAEYEVVAVLLGDQYPRALLRLPGEGSGRKVVIVKEADKLGNRKGVISKITLEGISVQQAQRSSHGFVDKTEVMLKVGAHADEQRKSLAIKQSDASKE